LSGSNSSSWCRDRSLFFVIRHILSKTSEARTFLTDNASNLSGEAKREKENQYHAKNEVNQSGSEIFFIIRDAYLIV